MTEAGNNAHDLDQSGNFMNTITKTRNTSLSTSLMGLKISSNTTALIAEKGPKKDHLSFNISSFSSKVVTKKTPCMFQMILKLFTTS